MINRKGSDSISLAMRRVCALAACALSTAVHAQGTADGRVAPQLEEVVVTADRRNAVDIQKAPIAISVVNPEELARLGGQGFSDYLEALPSVFLEESSPGQNQFIIRGMSISPFNHTTLHDRSLVSVYLDDTPISLQGNTPDLEVFDLERIEVVRGPQGTLFGAGAMAGNIRYITRRPQLGEWDMSTEGTVSETYKAGINYSIRGMLNAPIGDTLALRLTGFTGENDGYIYNVGIDKDNANDEENTQARAVLRYAPSDSLTIDASHTYARLRSGGGPEVRRFVVNPLPAFKTNDTNIPEQYNDDFNLSNLTVSYAFEPVELISSTSYIDRNFDRLTSGQYLIGRRGLGLAHIPWDDVISTNDIQNTLRTFSQELRIQSRGDQRLSWITGLYYEDSERSQLQDIPTPGYDANAFEGFLAGFGITSTDLGTPRDDTPFYGDTKLGEKQWAVFGEMTYEIVSNLDVTLGARYFEYEQDFNLYFAGILGIDFDTFAPLIVDETIEENDVNPRLRVSYQVTDDLMFFAEAAQGFRLGGVNQPLPLSCGEPGPLGFGSDTVWTYQIGERSSWLEDRLIVNLTAYLNDWEDVQAQRVLPECSYLYTANGGNVRGTGVELESKVQLTDRLILGINASYNKTEADGDIRFPDEVTGGPDVIIALDGQRAPGTPEYSGSATLNYTMPLFVAGTLELSAAYQLRGGYFETFDTREFIPGSLEPDFSPVNRRLDLAVNFLSGGAWEAGVFVRNATDEVEIFSQGFSRRQAPNPDFETRSIGRGRTIGLRFRYNF